MTKKGEIQSKVRDESLDERKVYEQYYEYSEPISRIVPHRILAMNREDIRENFTYLYFR